MTFRELEELREQLKKVNAQLSKLIEPTDGEIYSYLDTAQMNIENAIIKIDMRLS